MVAKIKKLYKGDSMMEISKQKQDILDKVFGEADKKFGKGTIQFGECDIAPCPIICSSGSLSLDSAIGVGGYPRGRNIEVGGMESSGKTTLSLLAIAKIQQAGEICFFCDAEQSFDPLYASRLGVDVKSLILFQPDDAEMAYELIEDLISTGIVTFGVVDSTSTLVPRAEVAGNYGDAQMGLQARLLSQALRKLNPIVAKQNATIFWISQIRSKIGVMFGCFSYNTLIQLADGTTEKIGKIVNQKMDVDVLSYNFNTKVIEPKKIKNWFNNGEADCYLQIKSQRGKSSGQNFMEVTHNHMIFTPEGEKPAEVLNEGDIIYTKSKKILNEDQLSVALGSILGDGSLRCNGVNTQLRIGHGKDQNEYCEEKRKMFGDSVGWNNVNSQKGLSFDLHPSYDLTKYVEGSYHVKGRIISDKLLERLNLRAIAIWYMDDGTFSGSYAKWGKGKCSISLKSYDFENITKIIEKLEQLGLPKPKLDKYHRITWYGKDSFSFQEKISKYILPCMDYKIHPELRGRYITDFNFVCLDEIVLAETKITSIKEVNKKGQRFDIEIEDNHNYFSGGMLVHNSPDVVGVGNAMKFYASLRIKTTRGDVEKSDEDGQGSVKVKCFVFKNKVAPAFKTGEFTLLTGVNGEYGLDIYEEVVDYGVKYEFITKAGTWYSVGEEKLGQGKANVKKFLKENPEKFEEIKKKITEKLFEDNFKNVNPNSFESKAKELTEDKKRKPRATKEEKIVDETESIPDNVNTETGEIE